MESESDTEMDIKFQTENEMEPQMDAKFQMENQKKHDPRMDANNHQCSASSEAKLPCCG